MDIFFSNTKLKALYETGTSRKYKLDAKVIQSFFEVVSILESARDIHDLWKFPSLNFEKLKGFESRYSARLDRKWRLEMDIQWQNEEMTIGIIGLDEISNHYGGRHG